MAGSSVTITRSGVNEPVKRIKFAWVSDDTTGVASGTTTFSVDGQIHRITTDPGATAPTADYDITLKDDTGVDVLQGLAADRHTSNTEDVNVVYSSTSVHPLVKSPLTLAVTNAGNSKVGDLYVYYTGA